MSTNKKTALTDTNQSLNTYNYDKTFTISICYAAGYDLVGWLGTNNDLVGRLGGVENQALNLRTLSMIMLFMTTVIPELRHTRIIIMLRVLFLNY